MDTVSKCAKIAWKTVPEQYFEKAFMSYYTYHAINSQLKIIDGIIKAISEPDSEGVFEGILIKLVIDDIEVNTTGMTFTFKQFDEVEKGYSVVPIQDPNTLLKEVL